MTSLLEPDYDLRMWIEAELSGCGKHAPLVGPCWEYSSSIYGNSVGLSVVVLKGRCYGGMLAGGSFISLLCGV